MRITVAIMLQLPKLREPVSLIAAVYWFGKSRAELGQPRHASQSQEMPSPSVISFYGIVKGGGATPSGTPSQGNGLKQPQSHSPACLQPAQAPFPPAAQQTAPAATGLRRSLFKLRCSEEMSSVVL